MLNWRFLVNAISNLGRGGTAAILAIVLPPILVREMSPVDYGVWVLVLQAVGYVGYLDFGLQTAVGRFVAFATENRDLQHRDSIFSTAFIGLCVAAVLGILVVAGIALALGFIFPNIPNSSIPETRWALLILGISVAAGLPTSAWSGFFIGHQRFEVPALIIGGGRLVSAVATVVTVLLGGSIVAMACVMALTNLLCYGVHFVLFRRTFGTVQLRLNFATSSTVKELSGYCFGLSVMSFSMLLVTGFDLLLVGRFEFGLVAAYSVCASLVTFVTGGLFAVLNVLLPHAAGLHAKQNSKELGNLVVNSTRITVLVLLLLCTPLFMYAGPILTTWVGPLLGSQGEPILMILLVATFIRLIAGPFAIVLIAVGKQNVVKVSPLLEGVVNLVASLILGAFMGAVGVAWGTLIGAVIGLASHFLYSMPKTRVEIHFPRRKLILTSVLLPAACTAPLLLIASASGIGFRISRLWDLFAFAISLACAAALVSFSKSSSLARNADNILQQM